MYEKIIESEREKKRCKKYVYIYYKRVKIPSTLKATIFSRQTKMNRFVSRVKIVGRYNLRFSTSYYFLSLVPRREREREKESTRAKNEMMSN